MTVEAAAGTRRPTTTDSPEVLAFTLSLIAGLVDVSSYVLLDGLFTAHVTGNVVVLGADVALRRRLDVTAALAVPTFVLMTAALTVAVDRTSFPVWRWRRPFLVLQAALLVATSATALLTEASTHPHSLTAGAVALLAVSSMATQNALLHLTMRPTPSTAVMTGNVVAATIALVGLTRRRRPPAAVDSDRATWHRSWPLLAGFAGGCTSGALACHALRDWGWAIPALLGVVAAVLCGRARHE